MPLVLAHRGANKVAPQNTIPAFKKAIEFNADGLETDVHLSKDGHIVICHNYTIDETSNGVGRVDEMTLSELKNFDFGSYFSDDFKGVSLPTLPELLDLTKSMKLINIEIKPPKKDCEGAWKGNHDFMDEYRNKMTHRNSPNVAVASNLDLNLKHHPTFILKRMVEDYVQAFRFIGDILKESMEESGQIFENTFS